MGRVIEKRLENCLNEMTQKGWVFNTLVSHKEGEVLVIFRQREV